ncbi:MAG: hypothetical protein RIR12_50 [Bacteroidota bacterium]|jgi:hypothetical protein
MLEIIALIWLTGLNGKLADRKGKKPGRWKLYTVLAWIVGEFLGALLAVIILKSDDYLSMFPLAIMGAIGGYLAIRALLSNMPDKPTQGFDFENNTP